MSDVGVGLGYWLPRTQFAVAVTRRHVVRTAHERSELEEVQDVEIVPSVVQDPAAWHTLTVDAKLMEKIALTINVDDRGFIQSINGEAGRDLSPVVSLIGAAVGLLPVPKRSVTAEGSLEKRWEERHPGLVTAATALAERSGELLTLLGDKATTVAGIVEIGAALDVLQAQLATISQARRTWIAGHAKTVGTRSWRLTPAELLRWEGPELPEKLNDPVVPASLTDMAGQWHVLVAILDPRRPPADAPLGERTLVDEIVLRRSRPVTIGAYRHQGGTWCLDPDSVTQLDVVDERSPIDHLTLDGSWRRTNTFTLSYHPDMSLKSFGVTSAPNLAAVAKSAAEVADSATAARKEFAARPSADAQRLAREKTQLELLQTANAAEILAATRTRSVELAILEQQKKLHEPATA